MGGPDGLGHLGGSPGGGLTGGWVGGGAVGIWILYLSCWEGGIAENRGRVYRRCLVWYAFVGSMRRLFCCLLAAIAEGCCWVVGIPCVLHTVPGTALQGVCPRYLACWAQNLVPLLFLVLPTFYPNENTTPTLALGHHHGGALGGRCKGRPFTSARLGCCLRGLCGCGTD